MFVICSNMPFFAPECWKYIIGPDFKIFPETRAFVMSFFLLNLLQRFWHLLKILLKTLPKESTHP